MFYTSYFANLRNIPSEIVPIAICDKAPDGWSGLQYKKLAPSWSIYSEWKFDHHNNEIYTKRFKEERLAQLNQIIVVHDLLTLTDGKDFVLVCYEKSEDFCHRHLVADWLTKFGYETKEWINKK